MILHDAIQAELLLNSTAMPELSSRAASIDDNEAFVQFPTPTSTTANFDLLLRYQHHKYPYFAGVFIDGHEVPQAQTIQYQPSTSPTYFQAKFSQFSPSQLTTPLTDSCGMSDDSATLAETLTKNVVLKLWECQCDPKTGTVTLGATIARFEWIYATAAQLRQLELIPHRELTFLSQTQIRSKLNSDPPPPTSSQSISHHLSNPKNQTTNPLRSNASNPPKQQRPPPLPPHPRPAPRIPHQTHLRLNPHDTINVPTRFRTPQAQISEEDSSGRSGGEGAGIHCQFAGGGTTSYVDQGCE